MMKITEILAAASPKADSLLNWILSALLLGALYLLIKKATAKSSTTGEPNSPVHVKMEDHFVTRREFDDHRASQATAVAELKGMQLRIFDKMDERDKLLTDKIAKVAEDAYGGRIRIHQNVEKLRERVAVAEHVTTQNKD